MLEDLTVRERELFDLLLKGVSPKEIAHKLNITLHTVAFHRTKLYNKLGVQSIQELFTKYSINGKAPPPEALEAEATAPVSKEVIIPVNKMGFCSMSDTLGGGTSTAEIYITEEEIDGVINSVLNIKTNLVKRVNNNELYAKAYTSNNDVIQQLRKANGIRFKALGDGKSWAVEFQTIKSTPETNYAYYAYMLNTVRDQVIVVDIPYSSLFLPEWFEQYAYDFDKEIIKNLSITANFTQGYGSSFLQIFDFEIY
jgi:DNA-binding CsgD family transcriptional regulator